MPAEVNPRLVFDRLFANGSGNEAGENRALRDRYHKSILDFVLEDANRLKANLGYTDRRNLDEYLAAAPELQPRIEPAEQFATALPKIQQPARVPNDSTLTTPLPYHTLG